MIEIKKSYVLELTEEQVRQLYNLLQSEKEQLSYGEQYNELRPLFNELKQHFNSGVR